MMSYKEKTITALFWSFFERFGNRIVTLLFSIILARLLSPSEYGVVAMPSMFVAIAGCVTDCGFASALIRKNDMNDSDLNTAFLFNVSIGVFCYIILWIVSPRIAQFYNTPVLEKILKISSLTTIIGPLCSIQKVLLLREIEFKTLAKFSIISSVISGVTGITLAFQGFGVWSLVIQGLSSEILCAIMFWRVVPWRPQMLWSHNSFRYLWNYGSKLLLSSLINIADQNLYIIAIGKYFNDISLGNFVKGVALASIPSQHVTDMIQRVTYPILSKMQDDEFSLTINYRRLLKFSAYIIFPLMIGLCVAAKPIVVILLGNQWNDVIFILQLVSLGMMLYPFHAINLNLLQVKGRTDLFLQLEIIKTIMGIVSLCIAIPHGMLCVAGCVPILSFLSLFVNTFYTDKIIKMGILKQLGDIFPDFLVSVSMGMCILLLNIIVENLYIQLVADVLVGFVIYLILSQLFLKDEWRMTLKITYMLKSKMNGQK